MQINVSEVNAPLITNPNPAYTLALGYVAVQDNTLFYPGAHCAVYTANMSASVDVLITELLEDGTTMGCRIFNPTSSSGNATPNYGRSNMSAFTTGASSRINQHRQSVRVEPATQKTAI